MSTMIVGRYAHQPHRWYVRSLCLLLTMLAALSPVIAQPSAASEPFAGRATGKRIPHQYIVVIKEGRDARAVAAIAGVKPKHIYTAALNGFAATLTTGQLRALQQHADVAYVEQDQEVMLTETQGMDGNGDPWGLDRIDQRDLPLSYSYTYTNTGAGVHVYIIDTGLQASHAEFAGRAANVFDAFGSNGEDCNGHGTHVAGTVGGSTYGVAKQVQLRGVRVLNCSGSGAFSEVIAGVDWVRTNAQHPAVANLSLGGGYSDALNDAVANLVNSGVFVAVAAGNDYGANACFYSPAGTSNAYTVAASDQADNLADFSNVGPCVDGYAPGVAIQSAWLYSGTNTINGTSMASPHVAGAAALYLSTNSGASPATITDHLNSTATQNVISGSPSDTPNRLLYVEASSAPPPSGGPDLYVIKKANTGSGTTEVHVLNGANNFQSFLLHTSTALHETNADLIWDFQRGDYNYDGVADLYAIARTGTGTGTTEVHVLNGANNFQSFLLNTGTALHETGNGGPWTFSLGDYNRDGAPDLYAIARASTGSGTTEVHILNGADNFQSFLLHTATALSQTRTDEGDVFELGDYNGDGVTDLYWIARTGTGTGTTEVHVLNGSDDFQSFLLRTGSALHETGTGGLWLFTLADYNYDGVADLYAIERAGGGSTKVHVLSGTNNFQSFLLNTGTALHETGSDWGWDFVQ